MEEAIKKGDKKMLELPLLGVPIGVKDLSDVRGMPTSHGVTPLVSQTPPPGAPSHFLTSIPRWIQVGNIASEDSIEVIVVI